MSKNYKLFSEKHIRDFCCADFVKETYSLFKTNKDKTKAASRSCPGTPQYYCIKHPDCSRNPVGD